MIASGRVVVVVMGEFKASEADADSNAAMSDAPARKLIGQPCRMRMVGGENMYSQ
jgi:hypothetical protein